MATARERLEQLKREVMEMQDADDTVIVDEHENLWSPEDAALDPQRGKSIKRIRSTRMGEYSIERYSEFKPDYEVKLIDMAFPQFKFHWGSEQLPLSGEFKANRNNKYKLKVIYPYGYPRVHPEIYIEKAIINGRSYIKELEWGNQQPLHMDSKNHIDWRANTWDPERSIGIDALTAAAV